MTRYVRSVVIEAAPLGAEAVLYDPDSKRFCQLNATAACVWETLQQPSTAAEISGAIRERFTVPDVAQVESDVEEALRQLLDLKLVQNAS